MIIHGLASEDIVSLPACKDWLADRSPVEPGDIIAIDKRWAHAIETKFNIVRVHVRIVNDEPLVITRREHDIEQLDPTAGERFARAMASVHDMIIEDDWFGTVISVHELTLMAQASIRSSGYSNRYFPRRLAYVSCSQGLRWVLI